MAEDNPQIGGKIRRLRRQRHIAQADLAEAIGISASYLNLIEHNRRNITVPLLFKFAGYFGIEPGELAESDDSQLVGDLMEIFGDDLFADSDLTNQEIRDLAFSNPVAGRAVLRLFDKYRDLATGGSAPATADAEDGPYHRATDAISDFLQENANHFPTLEAAAERVRRDIDNASDNFEQGLRTYLINVFGTDWRLASLPHGLARRVSADGRALEVADILPPETAAFTIAHHTGLLAADTEINRIIDDSTLPEMDAPALARNVLAAYFAAALLMPYQPFLKACQDYRYDVDRIARRFSTSFEQVCHRMTTLQRPGASGIPLHLIRTDIAGNISKRFSLSGIHIPRHSGACPRWNVYSAFLQPGRTNIQLSQMPDGETYFCIARSFEKGGYRHNAQRRHFSIGLGCNIAHAKKLIYADGIDLTNTTQIVPIGVGCRICPRMECDQRAHPPANHRFRLNDHERAESLYGRIE
ncbi:helix-turn-helix domain-containing protein [Mariluticola halotolerans]|uniref:helix-turn-helix domain-containing protein n=1 Tax=Mariluticola halotolerans TaxID=2909283 RepID=UPI0026E39302|nr:short-chain fatty acyl-CoA regulator family protein [Mariluticola halotolerans]UJQ94394.1 short-chain fatty acyl-CoA regulator family protein [Mariluticola halotolerans]